MKKTTVSKITAAALTSVMVLGSASAAFAGEYVVKKGDCLSKIAPKFDTTWQALADMNKLANPNLIFPNQVLQVPDKKMAAPVEEKKTEPVKETPKAEETKKEETAVKAELTGLTVDDITLTGNKITPDFAPGTEKYTMNVQSDVYAVKVTPQAAEGSVVTVAGEEVKPGDSAVVKLSQEYADYDVELSTDIEVVVKNGDAETAYTVTVVRACDTDTYNLFKTESYTDEETGETIPYELYVPSNYDPDKEYPVVFALHGSGQRAQTTDMVLKRYQMATVWAKDSEKGHNECIVLAPHCATEVANENWTTLMKYRTGEAENAFAAEPKLTAAYNLLLKVADEYSVDKNRIYMTGLSAGGFATYTLAIEHPETFAAIAPDAAGADTEKVSALKGMPMWIFHAADDPTVKPDEYLYPTLKALDEAGVEYKSTIYPEGAVFSPSAHFSWVPMYADSTFRDWLFAQSK